MMITGIPEQAIARYLVMGAAGQLFGTAFPWGTLAVNLIGSFLLGVLVEGLALLWTLSEASRAFLVVGVLGGFTTFSTFSLDVITLYERGQTYLALAYTLALVAFSVLALLAGLSVMRAALT